MIKIAICGINGQMGQVVANTIPKHEGTVLAAGIDMFPDARPNDVPVFANIADCDIPVDVVIDFSRPTALASNLEYCCKNNVPIIIATTGYTREHKAMVKAAAEKIPVFFSSNMSLGVNMQFELVKQVADFYGDAVDVEIIEKHHNLKVDAPSGTAVTLAEIINSSFEGKLEYKYGRSPQDGRREKKELGIHSIRGGTIVGEHDVLFITPSEVLTVSHQAQTKQVFADGAITAAKYIVERQPGLYSMKDIVYQSRSVTNLSRVSDEAVITVHDLPNDLGAMAKVFSLIAEKGINVDIIAQAISTGRHKEVSFSVAGKDLEAALDALSVIDGADITAMTDLTKISVEGLGMEVMYGVAAKVFSTLDEVDVDVLLVTTDETKITFCVTNDQADAAVHAVSSLFHKILK